MNPTYPFRPKRNIVLTRMAQTVVGFTLPWHQPVDPENFVLMFFCGFLVLITEAGTIYNRYELIVIEIGSMSINQHKNLVNQTTLETHYSQMLERNIVLTRMAQTVVGFIQDAV